MITCPICQSGNTRELIQWKEFTINKCCDCKVIFSYPEPTNDELEKFYQGFMFRKPEDYEIRKHLKKRKKELQELFVISETTEGSSSKKFLDYGGGTGMAYKAMSDFGLDSYYHDLDKQAKKFSQEKFGLTMEKVIEDVTKCNIKFDYILSDNVIEHVKNPHEFIGNLIKHLNSGGRIVIKTPHASNTELLLNPVISIKRYFLPALKYNSLRKSIRAYLLRFWCCDPPRHLYSFSKKSFDHVMKLNNEDGIRYTVSYYEVPWFENTITKQFFTKDKKLKGFHSVGVRILIFPIIPLELILQGIRKLLLKLKILSPGGLILTIEKNT